MVNVRRDPERSEIRTLHRLTPLKGARVLEIGCGDGRLTWQYAEVALSIFGIDTDASKISLAIQARPKPLANKLCFAVARGEALPFRNGMFDLAIMAWSF